MARRVRDVLGVAERLEAGVSPAEVKAGMRGSPYAADMRIKEARASDAGALRLALEQLAALELATRGASELTADTEALRCVTAVTA